ncbi:hypothetical protein [Streptomyces virginiae]|uniref:hypothetical protein n=1 Tax=Streptomyces virginiae TaxID=1961 RepID=UPI00343537C0
MPASSLLPLPLPLLLRPGRTDEARSHHLRGYRMACGNESLLPWVGKRIGFCVLTGNTSRGLGILAEHVAHVAPLANLDDRPSFHGRHPRPAAPPAGTGPRGPPGRLRAV